MYMHSHCGCRWGVNSEMLLFLDLVLINTMVRPQVLPMEQALVMINDQRYLVRMDFCLPMFKVV